MGKQLRKAEDEAEKTHRRSSIITRIGVETEDDVASRPDRSLNAL